MSGKSSFDGRAIGVNRPEEIRGGLELLRSRLETLERTAGGEDASSGALSVAAALSNAIERIMEEHAGMAEELLGVYEQLGVVFDVTRKLPSVRSESEVLDLFTDSLRRSFHGREVFLIDPPGRWNADGGWRVDGSDAAIDAWLTAQIEQARREKKVIVNAPQASSALRGLPCGGAPVAQVMIGPVFSGEHFVCAIVIAGGGDVPEFCVSDMLVIESVSTFCGDLIRNHRLVRELGEMSVAMVRSLVSAVDAKDAYTSGHSLRVAYYALLLGRELNLAKVDLQMLEWSALLHDVGKIGIREVVLNKQGSLTEEEFDHIREHPVRGYHVVKEVSQLADALDGVLHHHERYDGSGYPARLSREAIPLQARIVQVADVFDALTSTRSYRPAFDWRKALSVMEQEAGKTIDPYLQGVFDRLMRSILEGDPDAWDRLFERAGQSARALQEMTRRVAEPRERMT